MTQQPKSSLAKNPFFILQCSSQLPSLSLLPWPLPKRRPLRLFPLPVPPNSRSSACPPTTILSRIQPSTSQIQSSPTLNRSTLLAPPCYDEPVVQYPNGSNSSYQCWLSQQPTFDELDSPNDMLTSCKQNNWRPCFYLGNDHIRSPSLGYDYFFRVTGSLGRARFMALQSYTEQLCLDAFWDNNNLYVHGYTCDPNNPNQWWNFNVNLDTSQSQLIQHGGHPGWCLQTNGLLSASNFNNVQMIPCNGGVLEQQKRLYFGAFGS
ncbi:hypothetical protein AC1031_005124 [Aphanomyces cochlioides]|nr:hypothetical protein AC1031_005124 [Aphanomyces cochlioides]